MSFIYTESELVANKVYTIQDIKKGGKEVSRFKGLRFIFKNINGSTASGIITGNSHYIPARALIFVKGYEARPVQSKNAHGFAVVFQNDLGIPVGRAYLNPTKVTDTHAVFTVEGKELKLPLDILVSLVRLEEKKSKEEKKALKEVSKDTGVSPQLIDMMDNPSIRADVVDPLPLFVQKLFPSLNVEEVRDELRKIKGVFADYDGELHETLEDAQKSNVRINQRILAERISLIVGMKVKQDMMSKVK